MVWCRPGPIDKPCALPPASGCPLHADKAANNVSEVPGSSAHVLPVIPDTRIIIIMKNFNRRDSHGHHGSQRRELTQHAHSHVHGSHVTTSLTLTSLTTLTTSINTFATTWCEAPTQFFYFSVHSGSVHVSAIHRTLTWSSGSLSCVCEHSCACSTQTANQHIVDSQFILLCSWWDSNFRPWGTHYGTCHMPSSETGKGHGLTPAGQHAITAIQ